MKPLLQRQLFDKILERYEKKSEAVDALSRLLNVGKDAVYRRFRGDTQLTPEELALLAQEYRLSIDSLIFEQSDSVFFSYNLFSKQVRDFHSFLENIHELTVRVLKIPGAHFYYTTKDVPIFQYMYSPELISFKLYVWGMTSWGFDFLDDQAFDFSLIPYPTLQLAEETAANYNRLPSTELWSSGIIDNTLDQIEYMATIEGFKKPEDALLLLGKLTELNAHMRKMAETGSKFNIGGKPSPGSASFNLYHNELVSTNNSVLVNHPSGHLLFTVYGNPNFLFTSDEKLCQHSENWFLRIISKSNSISSHSTKTRNWFFNRLDRKIQIVRTRIEQLLQDH